MKTFKLQYCLAAVISLMVLTSSAPAQTYTDLYDLTQATGSSPYFPNLIAQGQDGSLYSTMPSSYPGDGTTVVAPPIGGIVTVTHYFEGTDGFGPNSGLTLGMDGNLYGTTYIHSSSAYGTVFQVTPAGAVTVLYGFGNLTDGAYPWAPPIQASDGNLYGVTQGTTPVAYKITMPAATYSVLANLPAASVAPLVVGSDGNFYGTTIAGGKFNAGTVFQLTRKGVLKIIYSFGTAANDGATPNAPVMLGADNKLYGTTYWGGANGLGTVFQVTNAGVCKILHSFDGTDGSHPSSGLVQGSDSFLYGATIAGGGLGDGAFFKVNTKGTTYSVLHNFDGKPSGGSPASTVHLHTNGTIYGWGEVGPERGRPLQHECRPEAVRFAGRAHVRQSRDDRRNHRPGLLQRDESGVWNRPRRLHRGQRHLHDCGLRHRRHDRQGDRFQTGREPGHSADLQNAAHDQEVNPDQRPGRDFGGDHGNKFVADQCGEVRQGGCHVHGELRHASHRHRAHRSRDRKDLHHHPWGQCHQRSKLHCELDWEEAMSTSFRSLRPRG